MNIVYRGVNYTVPLIDDILRRYIPKHVPIAQQQQVREAQAKNHENYIKQKQLQEKKQKQKQLTPEQDKNISSNATKPISSEHDSALDRELLRRYESDVNSAYNAGYEAAIKKIDEIRR